MNIDPGINFNLVGLPDSAVKESQQRIEAALTNNGLKYPGKRILVNMAPADIRKEGPLFDLPIAVGILFASGQIKADFSEMIFIGELALDGNLRPISGVLSVCEMALKKGFKKLFLPKSNLAEARILEGLEVFPLESLKELIDHFAGTGAVTSVSSGGVISDGDDLVFQYDFAV